MSFPVVIRDGAGGERRLDTGDFPVALGGREAGIELLGVHDPEPTAWVGVEEGELYLQPAGSDRQVVCGGIPVTTSRWLRDGDVVHIGDTRITLAIDDGGTILSVEHAVADVATEPPVRSGESTELPAASVPPAAEPAAAAGSDPAVAPPAESSEASTDSAAGGAIEPAAFTPRSLESGAATRRRIRPVVVLVWAGLVALGAAAWLLFTMRSVEVAVEPQPDSLSFHGGLAWEISGRHLLRPGTYRLLAQKAGYRRLDIEVEVTDESYQSLAFALEKLPGLLTIDANQVEGAQVTIDGGVVGVTPLAPVELDAGTHHVRLEAAPRYRSFEATVEMKGEGEAQTLNALLLPLWAAVTFQTTPAGARVGVDSEEVGNSPVTIDLLAGRHTYELKLSGYRSFRGTVEVEADKPQTLPLVNLTGSDGGLAVKSHPSGATVTADGAYQGQTPIELSLAPGVDHEIAFVLAGYEPTSRQVRLASDQQEILSVELAARLGEVTVVAVPADAELLVDGKPRGRADQSLSLTAVPHAVEIRKEGYQSYRGTVTPRPGLAQSIQVTLKTNEELQAKKTPLLIRTAQDQALMLIRGGRFRMGASRREPGRRTNESRREVELTRPFYMGIMEVSNEEFRGFDKKHLSGAVGSANLEIDHHPVVRVTWEEAAQYCNWLSGQESLPPVYRKVDGQMVAVLPLTIGYRLPTEAEWAWSARYAGRQKAAKYPWGDSLPVKPRSGNYAGSSSRRILLSTLPGYDDGFPATAPVQSFATNAIGLYNIGGNASEWVHDFYTIYASGGLVRDPVGPQEGELHVIRGSSWQDATVTELRLAYRDYGRKPRPDVGFRLARYAE